MLQGFIKTKCSHCSGGIEFPREGVGLTIECPHCGGFTVLKSKRAAIIVGAIAAVVCAVGLIVVIGFAVVAAQMRESNALAKQRLEAEALRTENEAAIARNLRWDQERQAKLDRQAERMREEQNATLKQREVWALEDAAREASTANFDARLRALREAREQSERDSQRDFQNRSMEFIESDKAYQLKRAADALNAANLNRKIYRP